LVQTARTIPTIAVTADPAPPAAGALAAAGVSVLPASSLGAALRALRERGIASLLVEGGAGLAGALLSEGAVDRLVIFRAPVLLGADALPAFASVPAHALPDAPRWRVIDRAQFGDDTMVVYGPGG
jgi:diaminohydroxyphosphoribosylaminopyrimidine deaminase/5-amino-6-(5-phosphoribosylamino)uracil reductase